MGECRMVFDMISAHGIGATLACRMLEHLELDAVMYASSENNASSLP